MDDLISRQAAIDVIDNFNVFESREDQIALERKIAELPSAEDDDYWCTFDAETGRFVDWCSWYQGRWVVWTDNTVSEVRNVIAWYKPMEPYKGVTE